MWLNDADADYLARPRRPGQKWYLYPLLRMLSNWLPAEIGGRAETREKLANFVRSSWFEPPFSGKRLCQHFFAALEVMIASRRQSSSLLPPGQRLDVYASVTDLAGYPNSLRLNEELVASDQAHGAYCQLSHGAGARSDFADERIYRRWSGRLGPVPPSPVHFHRLNTGKCAPCSMSVANTGRESSRSWPKICLWKTTCLPYRFSIQPNAFS